MWVDIEPLEDFPSEFGRKPIQEWVRLESFDMDDGRYFAIFRFEGPMIGLISVNHLDKDTCEKIQEWAEKQILLDAKYEYFGERVSARFLNQPLKTQI